MSAAASPSSPSGRITQSRLEGVAVIRATGTLDCDLADDIRELSLDAHAPVIIDLTDCVLSETDPVRRIAADWQLYRPTCAW